MAKQTEKLEKPEKPDTPVVFDIVRPSVCSVCGDELGSGCMIMVRDGKAICAECGEFDHLRYLPSGNRAVTLRATKYSRAVLVVVRWSRSRKRYERQGILAEKEAIEQAQEECLTEKDLSRVREMSEAMARGYISQQYLDAFSAMLGERWPGCPAEDATFISEQATRWRWARSEQVPEPTPELVDTAVLDRIRHRHTEYDRLIFGGMEREKARAQMAAEVEKIVQAWRAG